MKHLKQPCNDCPFRKNSLPGWLADYTPQELHGIVMNEIPFPCHLTHEEDLDWEEVGNEDTQLCAGALRYMRKGAKRPRNPEIAKLVDSITINDCENILSVPEFFKHHQK